MQFKSTLAALLLVSFSGLGVANAQEAKPEFSANVALTSDYVFRGISQSDEHAAVQGGFDFSYGRFYAGVWGSSIDFGADNGRSIADIEIDVYGGYKFGWLNDRLETDLGVIYYAYPDAYDPGAELNFWELKVGNSLTVTDNFSVSGTAYYSPEFTGETGKAYALEGGAELTVMPKLKISGTFGRQILKDNSDLNYNYWNVGASYDFLEKFTIDARYHGSSCDFTGDSGSEICGNRFAATLSASF